MGADSLNFDMHSSDATAAFAARLGPLLRPGDTVLLTGDVGAGKTHLARHLIQSILVVPEDVPSPTFTIVQTYDTRQGPLWHADLYRLTDDTEVEELGLAEAFETAICLVEWPDRLGPLRPQDALSIHLDAGQHDQARVLRLTSTAVWRDRLGAILA
ncbi:hypothetical protein So717_11290 [Roseobacter cerasinus]|uniref:tRNA threonylcarbamoyladenosine biosynthesis protein TsaE n=1 Tax=Roseobacter cerasinus TaxID=2602289 RepID=A0A640VT27_9RHOB|nr:tRNA (adenosine(37)-N6)-threonylcarbamoyltransferase complex ATPase subunit type 1 TsaE [Roseobacter cerasinus]GFE49376.1 hypothetical protein So717_11290 [Roseobacter cerasinus]